MTNETNHTIDSRALIVDDARNVAYPFSRNGEFLDCYHMNASKGQAEIMQQRDPSLHQGEVLEGGMDGLQEVLRTRTYKVICLDGDLTLKLDSQHCDGAVIAMELRKGSYGELNQYTPIVNISSSHKIPGADRRESKDSSRDIAETVESLSKVYLR